MQVKDSKLIVMNENVQCYIDIWTKTPANISLKTTLPYYITQLYDDNGIILTNKYSVISANIIDKQQMYFVTLIPSQFKEFKLLTTSEQERIKSLKNNTCKVDKKRFNNPQNISENGQQAVNNINQTSEEYNKIKDTKMRVPRLNDNNEYVDEKNVVITLNAQKDNIEYELIDQSTYDSIWKVKHQDFIKTHVEYNKWTTLLEQDKSQMKKTCSDNLGIQAGSPEEQELNSQIDGQSDYKSMASYSLKMNHATDTYISMYHKHEDSIYYLTDDVKELKTEMKTVNLNNINTTYAKIGQVYDETTKQNKDVKLDVNKQQVLLNIEMFKYEQENNTNYFIEEIINRTKNFDQNKIQNIVPHADLVLKCFKLKWANKSIITTKQWIELKNNFEQELTNLLSKDMNNLHLYNDTNNYNMYFNNLENTFYRNLGVRYVNNLLIEPSVKQFYLNNFIRYNRGSNWKNNNNFTTWLNWFETELTNPKSYNEQYSQNPIYNLAPKTKLQTTIDLINEDKNKRRQIYQRVDKTTHNKQIVIDLKRKDIQNFKFNVSNASDKIIVELIFDATKLEFMTKTFINNIEETNIKQSTLINDIKILRYLEQEHIFSQNNLEHSGYYYITKYVDEQQKNIFEDVINFNGFDNILQMPQINNINGNNKQYDFIKIEHNINSNEQIRKITLKDKTQTNFKTFVINYIFNNTILVTKNYDYEPKFFNYDDSNYKISNINVDTLNDTKTFNVELISNTKEYLINPYNWDNQNRISLLTDILIETNTQTHNKHFVQENFVLEKYKSSTCVFDVVLEDDQLGQLEVRYDSPTQKVQFKIQENETATLSYPTLLINRLIVLGNDNNDYLIEKIHATKQLSDVIVDEQRLFNFTFNVTNKENQLITQINKIIDLTYTTYDNIYSFNYKNYVVYLKYEVSQRKLRIQKIYKNGIISGDIKVTLNSVNIQWTDENPENKHKTIDFSGSKQEIETSTKEHLKYIVKDSILNVWDEDYFNYRLDKPQPQIKVKDLQTELKTRIDQYFSVSNQTTKTYTMQQMLDDCLKLAPTQSNNLDKLQKLENLKYLFIEEDMHNKIQLEECKNYDIIIVDKIRQIIHDTNFKELGQGYKDIIYNELDNLQHHQNVQVVEQELEKILTSVTNKFKEINSKYSNDQINLKIYVNYQDNLNKNVRHSMPNKNAHRRPSKPSKSNKSSNKDELTIGKIAEDVISIGSVVGVAAAATTPVGWAAGIGIAASILSSNTFEHFFQPFSHYNNVAGFASAGLSFVSPIAGWAKQIPKLGTFAVEYASKIYGTVEGITSGVSGSTIGGQPHKP